VLKYNPGDEAFGVLLQRLVAVRGTLQPRDATKMLWALATMQLFPTPAVQSAVETRVVARAGDYQVTDISILLWALAASGANANPALIEALSTRACELADDCPARNICTLLWALTVRGSAPSPDSPLARALLRRIKNCQEDVTDSGMSQLHQYFLDAGVGGEEAADTNPEAMWLVAFAQRCRATFLEQSENRLRQSAWQLLVARSLRSLCVFVDEEVLLEESGYYVDMLVLRRKRVIEVDGPDHFARPAPGPTEVPRRPAWQSTRRGAGMGGHASNTGSWQYTATLSCT
jgi:hypothetical protein